MSNLEDSFEEDCLHFAAADGALNEVQRLVDSGVDVNKIDSDLKLTPLHYAARGAHIEVMHYLISVGADVNANCVEVVGETPLGDVSSNCSFQVAKLLVDAGANPTIRGGMQQSALDRASRRKKPEGIKVYELLLDVARTKFRYGS